MPKNTESSWTLARVAHVLPSLAARPRDSLAFISLRDAVCPADVDNDNIFSLERAKENVPYVCMPPGDAPHVTA